MENLKAILEALILASDTPLSIVRMKEVLGSERSEIVSAINELVREYNDGCRGIYLQEVAGGFQFRTNPEMGAWIKKLKGGKPATLSQAALETLAIIAYRQPVVKADIERMRGGVDVGSPLKGLLDKKLVKMVGRKDVPGKPILYGTTRKFLETFNLKDLSELPTLRELKELQDKYEQKQTETYDFEEMQAADGEPSEEKERESAGELTEADSGSAAHVSDPAEISCRETPQPQEAVATPPVDAESGTEDAVEETDVGLSEPEAISEGAPPEVRPEESPGQDACEAAGEIDAEPCPVPEGQEGGGEANRPAEGLEPVTEEIQDLQDAREIGQEYDETAARRSAAEREESSNG